MSVLYAQTSAETQFFYDPPSPVAGLSLKLPEGSGEVALVTLNVPNSYTNPSNGPNAWFGISVDGVTFPVSAAYSYSSGMLPGNPGRVPTTLVVGVPLTAKPQEIVALAGNCVMDSPATLSAIV